MLRTSSYAYAFFALFITLFSACTARTMEASVTDTLPKPMMAKIDSTEHLYFYKPDSCNFDLVTGVRPDTLDENILFCAEAAFTGVIADTFYHGNIAGNHVSEGLFYKGYVCKANKGGFIFYKDKHWEFLNKETYNKKLKDTNIVCAYEQALLVAADTAFRPYLMKPTREETYRVLCENKKGELMVVTSKADMPFANFVKALIKELDVKNALYMDMGKGWNYSWYRNDDGTVTTLFPIEKWTSYQTNWLVVRKEGGRL